jgi:hypothetical protein
MNRMALLFVATGIAVSGCHIRADDGQGGYYDDTPSGAKNQPCGTHAECRTGCYCDRGAGRCQDSRTCAHDTDCPAGFRCDGRSSCVPRDESPVDAGVSADAAPATHGGPWPGGPDAGAGGDAIAHPSNLGDATTINADGGTCDAAATNGGSCAPRCTFDQQCGPGGRCSAGSCQRPCAGGCGTGAVCQDGLCQPDRNAGGQCVYGNQCGPGGDCINGYCHPGCTRDADCPNHADVCDRGVCRPDERPAPPCTASAQCPATQSCVDGLCRPGCACDADCAPWCSAATCVRGFCSAAGEVR